MKNKLFNLDKSSIWNEKQNKPSLVVKDLKEIYPNIEEDIVYEILLRRGVFKWLSVRRDLIKLKNIWKEEIIELNQKKKTKKEIGYLKALENTRKQIRKLCHSDRFVCPDFDSKANKWLNRYDAN